MRSFLPTWLALAAIIAVQMATLVVAPEDPAARELAWSPPATVLVAVVVITATGAWAFPRVRATTWMIGAMATTLIGLLHGELSAAPAEELFGFYAIAAILLAVGAVERARTEAPVAES